MNGDPEDWTFEAPRADSAEHTVGHGIDWEAWESLAHRPAVAGMHSRPMTPAEHDRLARALEDAVPAPDLWEGEPMAPSIEGFTDDPDAQRVALGLGAPWDEPLTSRTSASGARGPDAPRTGVRRLDTIPSGRPEPLLFERLDPEGHTILFGDGDTGKGVIAAAWIVELVQLGHVVLIVDYEDHPAEWARRVKGFGGEDSMRGVFHVSPLGPAWQGRRSAIWDQADDLRRLADSMHVFASYVVVDSIVVACGGTDPLKPEAAGQYAGALQRIGRPTLSLAHVPKANDGRYPFGSVFWHNLARITWGASKRGGAGHRVLLRNRKHNNHPPLGKHLVEVTWSDGIPVDIGVREYNASLADEIAELLGDDALPVGVIVDRLDEDLDEDEPRTKPDSVSKALRRGAKADRPRFRELPDGRWSNA